MKASVKVDALRVQLANASVFASTDKMRPVLNTVRVEFGAPLCDDVRFVATNSYELALCKVQAEAVAETGEFLLDLDDVKRLLAAVKPYKFGMVDLVVEGDTFTATIDGSSLCFRRVPYEFPNYEQIIGQHDDGPVDFWPFRMAGLKRLAKLTDPSGSKPDAVAVRMFPGGSELKPAVFKLGPDVTVLAMPTRANRD
jgi:hypothetical protein